MATVPTIYSLSILYLVTVNELILLEVSNLDN